MNYSINKVSTTSDDVRLLSDELHKELEQYYGEGIIEDFIEENQQMLIFYAVYNDSGKAAACGALKHFDDVTAEIKRMYVKPEFRGRGISKQILVRLEEHVKELGYKRIVLETGLKQPEAMSLYSKFGYSPLACYGRHADDPDSRCFEKRINQ